MTAPLAVNRLRDARAQAARTPIDLLHPGGVAGRVAVIGSGCPAFLFVDDAATADARQQVDALIFAPDARECRTARWLAEAAATTDRLLESNGIAYVVVPRRWRSRATRLLERRGFVAGDAYLHLRQGASSTYLVPCHALVARRLLPTLSAARALLAIADVLWSIPGAAAVARRGWPDVGVVLQRAGARRSAGWTSGDDMAPGSQRTLIRYRSRAAGVSAVVAIASAASGETEAILKVPLTGSAAADRRREAAMMSRLRDAASSAGAVMAPATVRCQAGRPILHLGVVRGVPAVHALGAEPRRLPAALEELSAWLARWNLLTREGAVADPLRLHREIIAPATALAGQVNDGAGYVRWLERKCLQIAGLPLPVVASHNDLTMSNVLFLTGRPPFAILDWEAAREDGLPLTDFFYAAASARGAAQGRRWPSLLETFDGSTPYGRAVERISSQISEALSLDDGIVELLKHACALQHAINEQQDTARSSRPFLALVQWLASTRGAQS